ncbi:MAG: efflux RND transporter periplasmic adaptor subunit [Deltaproteobacteria bacterium]|nr:efflux RND transporter periplasmic adaptor subunit [Deltaproteobacteria bacterium]MBW2444487.1 efflux RND transporter periplasmic adaptor subunit [Deltaproteobacteria bacterium]
MAKPLRHFSVWMALGISLGCAEEAPPPPPPPEIAVTSVVQRDQPVTLEMVGETRGSIDIPIRARVDGFLDGMHFKEGRTVEKGQLLYSIDPRPFEAKVAEADGHVAEAVTAVAKARADLDRIRPLAEMHAVSQQDLDSAVAQYEAALGKRQAARAQREQAEIELGYTKVFAPVGGRIGITEVRIGEYVGAGVNSLLNYVSKIDPIRVRFAIDERNYLKIARRIAARAGEDTEGPGLELTLADGTMHEHRGRIVGTDAAIDAATGTFTLEADFPNPDRVVLAGQFARVTAVIGERKGALLVPGRAVNEIQGSYRIFVVSAEGVVSMRDIELGPRVDRFRIVEKGLQPGDQIALEGLQKLKDGMTVTGVSTALDELGNIVGSAEPSGA